MSKHTPGPWKTWTLSPDSDPECRLIVTTDDGEAEVCGIVPNPEDARLIAAAPELLELLERYVASDEGIEDNLTAEARAAIAKAKEATP